MKYCYLILLKIRIIIPISSFCCIPPTMIILPQLLLNFYHIQMISKEFLLVFALLSLCSNLSFTKHSQSIGDFCWKDTKPRGVGTIPSQCSDEQEKIGLLCYKKCADGYSKFGFDCHQKCPDGWDDQGLFCRLSEYGRGSGYAWKASDGFSKKKMLKRCEKDHGDCEMDGLIAYPKCRSGYDNFGCCICRPNTPNCKKQGMNSGIDLSCAKKVVIRSPETAKCGSNKDYDAGLCYDQCPSNMKGVGPVCWGKNPQGWVQCGMGAAKTSQNCGKIIFNQATSVGNLALSVATLGSSMAANNAKDAQKAAQLKKQYQNLKLLVKQNALIQKSVNSAIGNGESGRALKSAKQIYESDTDTLTIEDMIRFAAQIAALADPTGASDVIASYTYSKCSQL